ncbi:replication-relaxation family protein [Arthrobacter sp. UYCu723]
MLRPDLYVELAAAAGDEDVSAFFIEVDLGHESLPTLLGKALTYEEYRSTGIEQHQYGGFPQVIWAMDAYRATTAQRRRKSLQDSLERNSRLNAGMYRIQSLQDAAAAVVQGLHHD